MITPNLFYKSSWVHRVEPWKPVIDPAQTAEPKSYLKRRMQKLVAALVLPSSHSFSPEQLEGFKSTRERFITQFPQRMFPVSLLTKDDAQIDATVVRPAVLDEGGADKWVIYLPSNFAAYESALPFFEVLSTKAQVNVLGFNYRGVVRSDGDVLSEGELVQDAETCLRYLLNVENVLPEDILLIGKSLGAGVATALAARYPGVALMADRTFSSLPEVARDIFYQGSESWQQKREALREARVGILYPLKVANCYVMGFLCRRIGDLAYRVLGKLDWEMNSLEHWDSVEGRKLVVYHEDDEIMRPPVSLFHQLKERHGVAPPHIRLCQRFGPLGPDGKPLMKDGETVKLRAHDQSLQFEDFPLVLEKINHLLRPELN